MTICDIFLVRHGQTDDNKNPNWGSPPIRPMEAAVKKVSSKVVKKAALPLLGSVVTSHWN